MSDLIDSNNYITATSFVGSANEIEDTSMNIIWGLCKDPYTGYIDELREVICKKKAASFWTLSKSGLDPPREKKTSVAG